VIIVPLRSTSLEDWLSQLGHEPLFQWRVCVQMACGVAALYEIGVLHRDLRPGSVHIEIAGNGVHAVIGDFSFACGVPCGGLTPTDADYMPVVYTVACRPPEILFGNGSCLHATGVSLGSFSYVPGRPISYGLQADVWALGCVCWMVLAGSLPFGAVGEDPHPFYR